MSRPGRSAGGGRLLLVPLVCILSTALVACSSGGSSSGSASPGGTQVPIAVAPRPSASVVASIVPPRTTFDVDGDEIAGWWWLRDAAGVQRATWAFFGEPTGQPIVLDLELLATDRVGGGPGVAARFYLDSGAIVEGAAAPPPGGGGELVVLQNTSPSGDPVGYTTTGTYTIPKGKIPAGAIGVWVRIGRVGPDGSVVSEHIAVREASIAITGLAGPAATAEPSVSPPGGSPSVSAQPSGNGPYGPLTITTGCRTNGTALQTTTGSAAPDLHLEFSPDGFTSVIQTADYYALSAPSYTYETRYQTSAYPDGIWVRWAAAPEITAHAATKGECPASSPSPEPSPSPGPPSGTPTIVSIGDSYISGEAGRWAGNSNDWYQYVDALGSDAYYDNASGTAEVIPGCHRSESAEVHVDVGGYGPVTTINLACSGATTFTRVPSAGVVKPGIDLCPNEPDRDDCPRVGGVGVKGQATLLEEEAVEHDVKAVVLSIGGNDFEFADTVAQCAQDFAGSLDVWSDYCNDDGTVIARFSAAKKATVKAYLVRAYGDIVAAMRAAHYPDDHWSLIVQNYPGPLPPGGDIRYGEFSMSRFNNGCPFWDDDADWANDTALPTINDTIDAAVATFSAAYPTIDVHVLDVSQAFVGHRLCEDTVDLVGSDKPVKRWTDPGASDGSEWVAQIRGVWSEGGALPLPGGVYYKNESFHPNYWGQLALRNCLRQAYDQGAVRGGTCRFMQTGLNAFGEPSMFLWQE